MNNCILSASMYLLLFLSMVASRNLHNTMFDKILRAPPRFFDINPSGTILNRFSKDIGSMDEMLPLTLLYVLWVSLIVSKFLMVNYLVLTSIFTFQEFMKIICIFIIVIYIQPLIVIPSLIVGVLFFLFRRFYLKTSRSVKRLEGVTKSPIFNQLSSSLHGLSTIRAFKAEEMMVEEFDYIQNIHSSAFFTVMSTTRWFGVYLDWIVLVYLLCCVLSFLVIPGGKYNMILYLSRHKFWP